MKDDDTPTIDRIFSLRHFHETMLKGRQGQSFLDHIKYIPLENKDRSYNLIFEKVAGDLLRYPNWFERYGLDFNKAMNLEYHDYKKLLEMLKEHSQAVEQAAPGVEKELLAKYPLAKGRSLSK